ncbi:DUF3048 domain-containing protein [Paenibacillus sp. J5C_2022]|uniref:DUF3048 domain-containing protein n=1 Tax=Paenibacillus sp. J5C2022 TaxID=2977129 RepID=UPI0021CE9F7E|nr:DUF3048 domain-containing protein [Paenibacillus sp. J5C2022]MCU6711265.1 DUF3048 domain-containing protein [Paenibacillus sp. J5C2022]
MKGKARISLTLLLTVILVFLSACGSGSDGGKSDPVIKETMEPTATVDPTAEPTPTPLPYAAPLTGIGIEKEASARPMAVLINNLAPARPQSGLTEADVIWEVLAEGGITRLVAIFQSTEKQDFTIGPIRSNRPYLIEIAESYGSVIAHAGGSPEAYGILQNQRKPYLDEITNAGTYFWRSKDRKAPHNLYSNLEQLRTGADKKGYSSEVELKKYIYLPEGAMNEADASTVEDAKEISIKFLLKSYKVGYKYDESTNVYIRSINDKPHIDMNNDEQLSATNLIVFQTGHKTLDDVGRLAIDLKSGGDALLFQKGKVMEAEWVRAADGMIRFHKDGKELALMPGKTYIHVVPNTSALRDYATWESASSAGTAAE